MKVKDIIYETTHFASLDIGNTAINCAVLENGVRVIRKNAFFTAFGLTPHGRTMDSNLPTIIGGKNLMEFITPEIEKLCIPYKFVYPNKTNVWEAYDAKLLPHICMIYKKAFKAGKIVKQQENRVKQAEILLDALAIVGITALIDEATGYELDRQANELANILTTYIAEGLMPYNSRFPLEYYQEIYRLYGWNFDPSNPKKPQVIGWFTNKYIYGYFPESVLSFIKKKSIVKSKDLNEYKIRYYRFLSKDIGLAELDAHIKSVITIMRLSEDINDFKEKYKKAIL
jgi:hypothetical protein